MKKRLLLIAVGLLLILLLLAACDTKPTPDVETEDSDTNTVTTVEGTEATTPEETETEPVTESPYLIADPTRIDLTTFTAELFKASFNRGTAAYPELCDEGVKFIARNESRDPCVPWNPSKMFAAAGYPMADDGKSHVPFTPEEKKVIVFKIQAEWGGAFEMFYSTEDRRAAKSGYSMTEVYGGDSEFFHDGISPFKCMKLRMG